MKAASPSEQQPVQNLGDVVCFANDWAADPLSKKQVMTRLARRHRVLWINSINNRRPRLAKKDFRRVFQKLGDFSKGLKQAEENIWVLSPIFVPFHGRPLVRSLNRWLLGWQIRRAMRRLRFANPITWTYVPSSADVVGTLGERLVVYHCVDEYGAFSDAAPEIREREQELLAKCGLVIVCSAALLDSKKKANPHTHLVTHGVDYEHFRRAADPATPIARELAGLPRPILGFHGLIADWVDLPLLAELARHHPQWTVVLVGRPDTDTAAIAGIANIHVLGHRPYAKLPEYLRGFDIALLPFINNELTISANPLKLREYLAAGLPVVATPIPEVARLAPPVRLASTADEYAREIETLLQRSERGPAEKRADRWAVESWDHKVQELELLVEGAIARGAEETSLLDLPELRDRNLRLVRKWKGRHSELVEYGQRNGNQCPVLVKKLVRWKDSEEAEGLILKEAAALERVGKLGPALRDSVPSPIAALPKLKTLIVHKVPGEPLAQILRRQANRIAGGFGRGQVCQAGQRSGEWLRQFHDATRQAERVFDAEAFLAALQQRSERCAGCGADRVWLAEVARLATAAARRAAQEFVPVAARQGDFLPQNILFHEGRIAVVDFENFSEADTVFEDLGAFLGYLALLRASPFYSAGTLAAMAESFLTGYGHPRQPLLLNLHVLKAGITIVSEFLRGHGPAAAKSRRFARMQAEVQHLCARLRQGSE